MNIADAYGSGRFGISFELFPPKTHAGVAKLYDQVARLIAHAPDYITCTYGAGGSTQDRTLEIVSEVHRRFDVPVATHLTCVGLSAERIGEYLQRAIDLGISNVVALRGDPPQGQTSFKPVPNGFAYANELVAFIRGRFPQLGIAVGGYPETHQEASSPAADIANLKRKVDAGADVIITQLFYDNDDYLCFRDRCTEAGIEKPIVPGLLPVTNFAQIKRITSLCGATLPDKFAADLQEAAEDEQRQFEIGIQFAIRQAEGLLEAGVPGFHFYVLNKSAAADHILASLNVPRN